MMNKIFIAMAMSFVTFTGFGSSAESGHAPSLLDLKYPTLNFIILFGFLFFKLKKPMSLMFTEKAKTIKNLYELAEEKSKEAKLKYEMFEEKMNGVDNEVKGIISNADNDAENFAIEQEQTSQELIKRVEEDAAAKVIYERDQLLNELNKRVVNEVISRTKKQISSDDNLKSKVAQRLLSHI